MPIDKSPKALSRENEHNTDEPSQHSSLRNNQTINKDWSLYEDAKKRNDFKSAYTYFIKICKAKTGLSVDVYTHKINQEINLFHNMANAGVMLAQSILGACYLNGTGVTKNLEEGVHYCKLAADQNGVRAQYNLGCCYQSGFGVTKNLEEAVRYYKLAADQNDAKAQHNLGFCYQNGFGVTKNLEEAVRYYKLAADQNDAKAQHNLGFCYQNGIGVTKNLEEAVRCYKSAFKGSSVVLKRTIPEALRAIKTPYSSYTINVLEKKFPEATSISCQNNASLSDFFEKDFVDMIDQSNKETALQSILPSLEQSAIANNKNLSEIYTHALLSLQHAIEQSASRYRDDKISAVMEFCLKKINFQELQNKAQIANLLLLLCNLMIEEKDDDETNSAHAFIKPLFILLHLSCVHEIPMNDRSLNLLIASALIKNINLNFKVTFNADQEINAFHLQILASVCEYNQDVSIQRLNHMLGQELVIESKDKQQEIPIAPADSSCSAMSMFNQGTFVNQNYPQERKRKRDEASDPTNKRLRENPDNESKQASSSCK